MRALLVLVCFLMAGCASKPPAYFLPVPEQPNTWVERYQVLRTFQGYEAELAIPPLEGVPFVGFLFSRLLVFRAGHSQDVVVPIIRKEGASFALSTHRKPTPQPQPGAGRWSSLYGMP